jgi:hypothetical protein
MVSSFGLPVNPAWDHRRHIVYEASVLEQHYQYWSRIICP